MEKEREVLKAVFGYSDFRPAQKPIVEAVSSGRDALTIMSTSGGKSLCFQIPAILAKGTAVVISPLISLMVDQVGGLLEKNVKATYISSDLNQVDANSRIAQMERGAYKLVYVSPERFASASFLTSLIEMDISFFVIDEAHCVSSMGNDFRPSYKNIGEAISLLNEEKSKRKGTNITHQKIAFTATATKDIRADIISSLGLDSPITLESALDRSNISINVIKTFDKEKVLSDLLIKSSVTNEPTVIYAGTKRRVDATYRTLLMQGHKVSRYHSGLSSAEKAESFNSFMNNMSRIIVCTSAFGLGVNKTDIKNVIHLTAPTTLEDYWQEIGRIGRDGSNGSAYLLFDKEPDTKNVLSFVALNYPSDAAVDKFMRFCLAMQEQTGSPELSLTTEDYLLALQPVVSKSDIPNILRILTESGFLSKNTTYENGYVSTYYIDVQDAKPNLAEIKERKNIAENNAKTMLVFCSINTCRRHFVLNYLGDISVQNNRAKCHNCDICSEVAVGTKEKTNQEKYGLMAFIAKLAQEKKVPSFIILSKQGIEHLLNTPPKTLNDLLNIPGMNPRKTEAFGNEILQFVNTNFTVAA
jgi:RecQ family ATP-dependent DNA helicase